jgi:hypothetical protein
LDENISSVLIAAPLQKLDGWKIHLHGDFLVPGASDVEVVTACGKRGLALLTYDELRHSRETVRAILQYNVGVFRVVLRKQAHGVRIMSALVQAQSTIIALMNKNRAAFCAHVGSDGQTRIVSRFEDDLAALTDSQRRTHRRYGRL